MLLIGALPVMGQAAMSALEENMPSANRGLLHIFRMGCPLDLELERRESFGEGVGAGVPQSVPLARMALARRVLSRSKILRFQTRGAEYAINVFIPNFKSSNFHKRS